MPPVRSLLLRRALPLALALLLVVPAVARAEEDDPAPNPPGEPVATRTEPLFSIEFIMPSTDQKPEVWDVASGKPQADGPTADALTQLATAGGLDDDVFYVETGVVAKDGEQAGYAMVDVDRDASAYRERLDALALERGWVVRELGMPERLLVVGGPTAQRAEAATHLMGHVVYALAELAMGRLKGMGGQDAESQAVAVAYAEVIGRIDTKSGVSHAVVGIVHWLASRPKKHGEKADPAGEEKVVAEFTEALADGVAYPPRKGLRVFVAGQLGVLLLERKDPSVLAAATRALVLAVEHEHDGNNNQRRYANRYNLACAYVRADKIDEAFKALERSIETGKNLPPETWRASFLEMRDKDPDMAPLRGNPRWSKLMADNEPPEPKQAKKSKGHP